MIPIVAYLSLASECAIAQGVTSSGPCTVNSQGSNNTVIVSGNCSQQTRSALMADYDLLNSWLNTSSVGQALTIRDHRLRVRDFYSTQEGKTIWDTSNLSDLHAEYWVHTTHGMAPVGQQGPLVYSLRLACNVGACLLQDLPDPAAFSNKPQYDSKVELP